MKLKKIRKRDSGSIRITLTVCTALVLTLLAAAVPPPPASTVRGASRYEWTDWQTGFYIETTTIVRADFDFGPGESGPATGTVTEVHIMQDPVTGEISSKRVVYEITNAGVSATTGAVGVAGTDLSGGKAASFNFLDGASTNSPDLLTVWAMSPAPGATWMDIPRGPEASPTVVIERGNYVVSM